MNIYNLHIHSKIHGSLLGSDSKLDHLFALANKESPVVLSGTRKVQVLEYLKTRGLYLINNPKKVTASILRRMHQKKGKI